MKVSKLQSEAVLEFKNKFCYTVVMGSTLNDGNQLRLKTERPEGIEQFLSDQIQKAVEETLDLIATDQGWEESRDIYADVLELPLKYPKLMEAYKKRNHIKGKIILDSQLLKEKQNDR